MTGRVSFRRLNGPSPILFVSEQLIGSPTQVASIIASSARSFPSSSVLVSPTMSFFKRRGPHG